MTKNTAGLSQVILRAMQLVRPELLDGCYSEML
jgi:hypothetical protein